MSDDLDHLRREIARHGKRRRRALETAEAELAAIAELAPEALAAGMTKMEITSLGAVSRPTLDAKLARVGTQAEVAAAAGKSRPAGRPTRPRST